MNNVIEKQVELDAPIARVWRALTNYKEFSQWFGVALERPFAPGQTSCGYITYPGFEHLTMDICVQKMEPERLFSFTWHPYALDPEKDYSTETPTLVEFRLEPVPSGTRLLLTETGFDTLPGERRLEAFRMNEEGWTEQMTNIKDFLAQDYVTQTS